MKSSESKLMLEQEQSDQGVPVILPSYRHCCIFVSEHITLQLAVYGAVCEAEQSECTCRPMCTPLKPPGGVILVCILFNAFNLQSYDVVCDDLVC